MIIKTKDLNKFINLKAENVIPYVKEAIRGATPDKFYSKDLKVFEDFIGKFKKTDFNKFTDISKAYYSVKMTMLNDEQKILERHESLFLGEKGYNVGTDAIKEMMAWTKAQRNLDKLKTEAITPQIWSKKFKGINSDIIDILSKENISPEDLKTDITIKDDKNGMTSDQVLFDISQRKLQVMNHFLTLIKEASIDCNINLKETLSDNNYFECIKFPYQL